MNAIDMLKLVENEKYISDILDEYTIDDSGIISNKIIKASEKTLRLTNLNDIIIFVSGDGLHPNSTYESLKPFLDNFVYKNYSDWRLPTTDELKEIMLLESYREDIAPIKRTNYKGATWIIDYKYFFQRKFFTSDIWHKKWIQMGYLTSEFTFKISRAKYASNWITWGYIILVRG